MTQIAVGSAIAPAMAPMIIGAKMLPFTYNNIKTAIMRRRADIVFKRLTNPFFSFYLPFVIVCCDYSHSCWNGNDSENNCNYIHY